MAVEQAWIDYVSVSLWLPGGHGYTYSAWTKPAYRSKGLASRMAWEKNQSLAAMGYPVMVAVLMPKNVPALRVTQRAGYKRIGMLRTLFLAGRRRGFLSLISGAPAISIAGEVESEQGV